MRSTRTGSSRGRAGRCAGALARSELCIGSSRFTARVMEDRRTMKGTGTPLTPVRAEGSPARLAAAGLDVRAVLRALPRAALPRRAAVEAQRPDPAAVRGKPLIVYFNHPSWWDPLICLRLAASLFPDRSHYGPIDAAALGKYQLLREAGLLRRRGRHRPRRAAVPRRLPGDPRPAGHRPLGRRRGALHRSARAAGAAALGDRPSRRQDPRRRAPAAGHRVPVLGGASSRRRSPASARRSRPATPISTPPTGPPSWRRAWSRPSTPSPWRRWPAITARFEVLLGGSAGVGGIYDPWRRLKARFRGERFRPGHGDEELFRREGERCDPRPRDRLRALRPGCRRWSSAATSGSTRRRPARTRGSPAVHLRPDPRPRRGSLDRRRRRGGPGEHGRRRSR